MDKDVVHIYMMKYYSVIKKEQNNVICSKVNATRDYTKWIGSGEGWTGSLELADANCYVQNE